MPLLRYTKLPPPPELGEKTVWDYFPRQASRRIFFLLLALGAVIFLKGSGGGSFGGLFDAPSSQPPGHAEAGAFQRIEVKPTPKSKP
jgi:hypothetical protein